MARNVRGNTTIKEQDIQKAILDLLTLRGYIAVKIYNGGIRKPDGSFIPPRSKGVSDILACTPTGRFMAIEVKRPGGKTTVDQDLFLDRIRQKGGLALVAYSIDDAIAFLDRYERYGIPA